MQKIYQKIGCSLWKMPESISMIDSEIRLKEYNEKLNFYFRNAVNDFVYNLFKDRVSIKYLKYLIFGLMIKRTIQEC